MTPELATIAQKLVDRHGLAESVRVRACHSSEVELHDGVKIGDVRARHGHVAEPNLVQVTDATLAWRDPGERCCL